MLILTNDDGIDAPGLAVLREAVQALGHRAIVVAPQGGWSGCGHQVTTQTPIAIEQRSPTEYAIGGTPVDCVRIALNHLQLEAAWVLAGVNQGGNLGSDVYISGTVAAVREAALHRLPGIAISQYRQAPHAIDWHQTQQQTARVLTTLLAQIPPPGAFWNVNLPHPVPPKAKPDLVFCAPCTQPLPSQFQQIGDTLHYASRYRDRQRDAGADVDVCFGGAIAITQLQV
mgnify:CR=1 FL=1